MVNGKICLITGANSGIGKVTALELAKMGAKVVMVCRNQSKGEAAMSEIKAKSGNKSVKLMLADLSSQRSIHRLVENFKSKYRQLHVLINNAGGIIGKRLLTEDGIEMTFAVNHLAYFLLSNLLLDELKSSTPARIVNVASVGHRVVSLDFDNLQGELNYSPMRMYLQSKLANILFTYELARRLEGTGVTVNCLHPGVVGTNFGSSGSKIFSFLVKVARPFLTGAKKGAKTSVYLASSTEVEEMTGKYFINKKAAKSSEKSYDKQVAQRLWQISAELTSYE